MTTVDLSASSLFTDHSALSSHARLRFFWFAFLLLLCAGSGASQREATANTFRIKAQMVLVPVTVTDGNGQTIKDLRPQDFTIFDDQIPQQILSLAREDAPSSVGLVLDTSGSMRNTLGTVKDVAHAFLGTANPDDEFLLLAVSTEPDAISGFTTDIAALEEDVRSTTPGGMTALIDTVYLGLSRMRQAKRPRRALLIVSDGMDNNSRYSKAELMQVALEADVQVYTIIIDCPSAVTSTNTVPLLPRLVAKPWDQGQEKRQGHELLEELAEKTGGLHLRARNDAEAQESVIKVGQAFRNEYLIGYQPSNPGASGKWHRVRVKSHVPKVNVHARSAYYSY
jgi:Ca-activated chloride channel family protein